MLETTCGHPASKIFIVDLDDSYEFVCPLCAAASGTCRLCTHVTKCSFETDPSPLPKYIRQSTQKQGFFIQQDVPNPDRIEITCRNGCPCFSQEFGCLKQNGTCGNYERRVSPNACRKNVPNSEATDGTLREESSQVCESPDEVGN